MGVLATTLRRNIGDGTLKDLEERLLDPLPADVASDRGVLVLFGDLVDFVDIDDALLSLLHVAVSGLQQLQNDVLNVFPHVAGFGEGGGVDDGEWHIQHAGKGLCKERLARAGGADQNNIGLAELDFAWLLVEEDALVVVINSDSQFFLCAILSNDVAIQELFDLWRAGQPACRGGSLFAFLVFKNGLANPHALITDVGARIIRGGTDQLLHLLLRLVAEGTAKGLVWAVFLHLFAGLMSGTHPETVLAILGRIFPGRKRISQLCSQSG